jgi:hypothetical protein
MRVVALADSDSYAKWAAALISRMPTEWQVQLVVVRTAKEPSDAQLTAALDGSRIGRAEVAFVEFDAAVLHVVSERPDVVLVATIGPLADLLVAGILDASPWRPVFVSGIPGIALPARRKALVYRSQIDLLVVHSQRELRQFALLAQRTGLRHVFGLATLPFISSKRSLGAVRGGGDVVFAAQAIVPPSRVERALLLGWLIAFAKRNPGSRLVIKVRALDGEGQTHDEADSYPALLSHRADVPPNLVIETGPMRERLASASALVTVSSTAAIEAIALGVPVLAIDSFGVTPDLINEVFLGSGLLGSSDDLLRGDFREANPEWLADNYFHDELANTWLAEIETLVARNRSGLLPRRSRVVRGAGGALRRAWDRKRVLGRYDRSLSGLVALCVGMPTRSLVLALDGLRSLVVDERSAEQHLALDHETSQRGEGSEPVSRTR